MKSTRLYLVVMSVIATFILSGCTPYQLTGGVYSDSYYYDGYNYGSQRDALYRNGVQDGCSSKKGIWRKNIYQYNNSYSYRSGWNAGYRQCRSSSYNTNYYYEGYSDGCWSSEHHSIRKNTYRYNRYQGYRNGWNNGYRECRYR
ncbi:MAG: hypothetical protein JXQ77_03495 [Campylobacterales bacterium]|nr:hypothetical protein [Campylobacterales bacterium]